jgi:hypothetical protein
MKDLYKFLLLLAVFIIASSNARSEWDLSIERIIAPSNNPEIQYNPEPGVRSIPLSVWVRNIGDEMSPDFVINYIITRMSDQKIMYQGYKEFPGFRCSEYTWYYDTVYTVFEIKEKLEPDLYSVIVSISYPDLPPDSEDNDLANNQFPRDNQPEHIFTVTDKEPPEEAKFVYDIYSPKSNEDGFYYAYPYSISISIGVTNMGTENIENCLTSLKFSNEDGINLYMCDALLTDLKQYHTLQITYPGSRGRIPGIYTLEISDCLKQGFPEDTNKYKFEIRDTVHIGDFDLLEVYSPLSKEEMTYSIYDHPELRVRVQNIGTDTIYGAKFKATVRTQYNVSIYESTAIENRCLPGIGYSLTFPDPINLSFGDNKLEIEYLQTGKKLMATLLSPGEEYIIYADDVNSVATTKDEYFVYPNPFQDKIIINLKEDVGNPISFSLFNSLGSKILEENILSTYSKTEIEIPAELLSGVYTYRIITSQATITGKLMKIE